MPVRERVRALLVRKGRRSSYDRVCSDAGEPGSTSATAVAAGTAIMAAAPKLRRRRRVDFLHTRTSIPPRTVEYPTPHGRISHTTRSNPRLVRMEEIGNVHSSAHHADRLARPQSCTVRVAVPPAATHVATQQCNTSQQHGRAWPPGCAGMGVRSLAWIRAPNALFASATVRTRCGGGGSCGGRCRTASARCNRI